MLQTRQQTKRKIRHTRDVSKTQNHVKRNVCQSILFITRQRSHCRRDWYNVKRLIMLLRGPLDWESSGDPVWIGHSDRLSIRFSVPCQRIGREK